MAMIIALQGCRHGIGCSNLAANLAVTLMQQGYRVGLFDTDAQLGGLRTLFGVDMPHQQELDGYWWLSPPASPMDLTLQADFRYYRNTRDRKAAGIYLPPLGGHLAVNSPQVQQLCRYYGQATAFDAVQQLSEALALDFVLIDNQPEMTEDTLIGLSIADVVLVLLQLDAFDLQHTAVLLEVIDRLEISQTLLVPSMVLPTVETTIVQTMLENTFDYPVTGVLYFSKEVVSLASKGVLCLHSPDNIVTQTVAAIAYQLEMLARSSAIASAKP